MIPIGVWVRVDKAYGGEDTCFAISKLGGTTRPRAIIVSDTSPSRALVAPVIEIFPSLAGDDKVLGFAGVVGECGIDGGGADAASRKAGVGSISGVVNSRGVCGHGDTTSCWNRPSMLGESRGKNVGIHAGLSELLQRAGAASW